MGVNDTKIVTYEEIHKSYLSSEEYNPEVEKSELSDVRHTGFYYDSQLLDPSMTMTLHPSTINKGSEWELVSGDVYPPLVSGVSYSKTPIAVCLLSEDPTFSVSNRFTDFNGGNPIEDIFNSMKPYAPLVGKIGEAAADITKSNTTTGNFLEPYLKKGAELTKEWAPRLEGLLNKSLFVQGTRFTYYNGSDFSTGQMEMKFTKFSEYNKEGKFINVASYINDTLAPYSFGRYRKLSETGADDKPWAADIVKNLGELADYVGVQSPPGGFLMNAKSLDCSLKGTLRLNIGGVYAIENLLIKNLTFSFSRSQAKDPEHPGKTVPLYADISISLCPASMITDNSMKEMLAGKGLEKMMETKAAENKKQLDKMKEDRKSAFKSVKIRNY